MTKSTGTNFQVRGGRLEQIVDYNPVIQGNICGTKRPISCYRNSPSVENLRILGFTFGQTNFRRLFLLKRASIATNSSFSISKSGIFPFLLSSFSSESTVFIDEIQNIELQIKYCYFTLKFD